MSTSRTAVSVLVAIVLTALAVGGGIYYWQSSLATDAQEQMVSLQEQIDTLEETNANLEAAATEAAASEDLELPVVVYSRPGLLNNTEEGQAEKENLEEKLVNPYIDYEKDKDSDLISIQISVPENIGEAYNVDAIFAGGGHAGFLFGAREGDYDYWVPECMGPCEFSDEFKAKYPEIVGE